ncbi:MAG: GNAT family N-acetyltransferase [Candidatus Omnitrophota bacterium]
MDKKLKEDIEVNERWLEVPCQDSKLSQLCCEYSDLLPCCNALIPRGKRFRDRAKILWGKVSFLDLFELKKELLKTDYFKFKTTSWCMFPVLKKGDTLKIESCSLNDLKIGEIPVYRRNNRLYSHRIVDKHILEGKERIITRPDTAKVRKGLLQEELEEEDLLGKVREVERDKKRFPLEKREANFWERFLYTRHKLSLALLKLLSRVSMKTLTCIQSLWIYRWLGKKLIKRLEHNIDFQLATPSRHKLEIYEYTPLEKRDNFRPREYKNFHIIMKLKDTPIGCVTFLNRDKDCPYTGFWLAELWIRLRYRGLGLESFLVNRAQDFLRERDLEQISYPRPPVVLKRSFLRAPLYFNSQELLIVLSKDKTDGDLTKRALSLIRAGIDWDVFYKLAIASGKPAAIMKHIKFLSGLEAVGHSAIDRLKGAFFDTIDSTTRNHRQLLDILKEFSKAKISVIPLKGTYLSQRLYGDISLRGKNLDIDLLIKEQDIERATALLKGLGYKERPEEEIKIWRWQKTFSKEGFAFLELQWDITMMLRDSQRIEGLWQSADNVKIYSEGVGLDICQWDNEVLLLYLCVTLINSSGYRDLRYFFDIFQLLENTSTSFDWGAFIRKARRYKINNSVFASLLKANEILNAKVPKPVLEELKPSFLKGILIRIFLSRSVIFTDNLRRRFMDNFLSYIFFELLEANSARDYLRIVKRVMFPPRELLEIRSDNPASARISISSNWQYSLCVLKRLCKSFSLIGRILVR